MNTYIPRLAGTLSLCAAATLMLCACGSSDSLSSPTSPSAVIGVVSWLVDLGDRYRLDAADSVDPEGQGLEYSWTIVHGTSQSDFDDLCQDDSLTICTSDSDCSSGDCAVGAGAISENATFTTDVPGPYSVRLTVETSLAADTEVVSLDTYPSLFVVPSLGRFGGTQGGAAGEFSQASTFASDGSRAVSNPADGNLLVVVPSAGLLREFDIDDGSLLGSFGETAAFSSDPVALAFDAGGDLYLADSDGSVRVYDGESGFFLSDFADVAEAGESVAAMAFDPVSGDLLVVDGGVGEAVRAYDSAGADLGDLGDTGTALAQAVDLAFLQEGASTSLFIADAAAGDLVGCDRTGSSCAALAISLLAAGGPTAVAVNPAASVSTADLLVADGVNLYVVACDSSGSTCSVFGDTASGLSAVADIVFAPPSVPTTTTTTTSTTTTL